MHPEQYMHHKACINSATLALLRDCTYRISSLILWPTSPCPPRPTAARVSMTTSLHSACCSSKPASNDVRPPYKQPGRSHATGPADELHRQGKGILFGMMHCQLMYVATQVVVQTVPGVCMSVCACVFLVHGCMSVCQPDLAWTGRQSQSTGEQTDSARQADTGTGWTETLDRRVWCADHKDKPAAKSHYTKKWLYDLCSASGLAPDEVFQGGASAPCLPLPRVTQPMPAGCHANKQSVVMLQVTIAIIQVSSG